MLLGRFLLNSKGNVAVFPTFLATMHKISQPKYSSDTPAKNTKKGWAKKKHLKSESANDLLNKVSWDLHPGDSSKKLRWTTRHEINSYMKDLNNTTATRRNTRHKEVNTQSSRTSDSAFNISDFVGQFGEDSQRKTPVRDNKNDINTEKVKQYVKLLQNNKQRLGIFDTVDKTKVQTDEGPGYKTAVEYWDEFDADGRGKFDEMEPKNHYQEMLGWSGQGKLPTFPIDNEVGMEEEQKVPFHKHVFLHELLDEGFPKNGPVRRFMEGVIVGLSKNPFLTVQEKEDHVNWFREYFQEKIDTLKGLGAAGEDKMVEQKI